MIPFPLSPTLTPCGGEGGSSGVSSLSRTAGEG